MQILWYKIVNELAQFHDKLILAYSYNPLFFYSWIFVIGAVIGSFLNVCILIAIVLMFLSFFYLYQKRVVEPSNKEVIVNKFEMLLMFNKDSQINGHNIKEGWEESREFTIENFSTDTIGKYNIILEIITPLSNMIDENFIYTVEGSSEKTDTSNKVINVSETPIPVVTKDFSQSTDRI